MKAITFPATYNNETAHRQVKQLMKQQKLLYIQVDGDTWISSQGTTGIRYQLNKQGWQWILNYLQTGCYEDFGVFPSKRSNISYRFQEDAIRVLIEQKYNIARIPFLRETEAYIKLRGLFKFGKLFFSIKRSDEFMDYLSDKGL